MSYMTVTKFSLTLTGIGFKNYTGKINYFGMYTLRCFIIVGLIFRFIGTVVDFVFIESYRFVEITPQILMLSILACSTFITTYFYSEAPKIRSILENMEYMFYDKSQTGLTEISLDHNKKIFKIFSLCWFIVALVDSMSGVISIFFENEKTLPLPIWVPYDWRKPYKYEMTIFLEIIINFWTLVAFTNLETLFVGVIYFTKEQYRILNFEIANLTYMTIRKMGFSKEFVNKLEMANNEFFKDELTSSNNHQQISEIFSSEKYKNEFIVLLKSKIKRHQELLIYVNEVKEFFSPLLLLFFGVLIFSLVCMVFSFVSPNASSVVAALYIWTSLSSGLMLTYAGQILINETNKTTDYIYESGWHLCGNHTLRISCLLMQMQALRPVVLKAGNFFEINLTLFISICKTTFTYYTFLKEVSV